MIEVGCDCKDGLVQTSLNEKRLDFHFVDDSHLDLINSIKIINRNENIEIIGRRITGHQDDYCMYEKLNWRGQRNVDMDILAKSQCMTCIKDKKNHIGIPYFESFCSNY